MGHRKRKSERKAQRRTEYHDQNHKEWAKSKMGGHGMEVAAYILAAIAGVLFVLVGLFYSEHKIPSIILFGVACTILTAAATLYWINAVLEPLVIETEHHGRLEPAHDPDPPLPPRCVKKYADSWGVFYGGSVNFNTRPDVTIVTIASKPLLAVRKTPDGLAISASIYGEDGRIVAEVKDNEFSINQNNYFRRARPDRSTLTVYDQFNSEVLSVRYVNPSAIRVTGVFRYAGREVLIDETKTRAGNFTMMAFCGTNSESVINI